MAASALGAESTEVQSKGKLSEANRSWLTLPEEIIRSIGNCHLELLTQECIPASVTKHWSRNRMYRVLRDWLRLYTLMQVAPQWRTALETHPFWLFAINVFDPSHYLQGYRFYPQKQSELTAGSAAISLPIPRTPYGHFFSMWEVSCAVCRVYSPDNSMGLAGAKVLARSHDLGTIPVCRVHHKELFCGICLISHPEVAENDDDETWPGVEHTCRSCRDEALTDRLHGHEVEDWEIRRAMESFVEFSDGSIKDVVAIAMDKNWMHRHTKISDMLEQALASTQYQNEAEGLIEEEEEEEEDIYERYALTEASIKDIVLSDWARHRILDGHWFCPADSFYRTGFPGWPTHVRAEHPCAWSIEDGHDEGEGDEEHPRKATVRASVPPSYDLCSTAFYQFNRQMRNILLPAMKNLVRRIVLEAAGDGGAADPAMRIARLSIEDVIQELRDEAMWYDGIDWLERRRNNRRDKAASARGDSSDSGSPHSTSPVLSTSTLQTTPSPPPKEEENLVAPEPRPLAIAVTPVLETPVLIHPIPYIPTSLEHLPSRSMEAIRIAWRDACAPLYHCRCSICERAMAKANEENNQAILQAANEEIAHKAAQLIKLKNEQNREKQLDPRVRIQTNVPAPQTAWPPGTISVENLHPVDMEPTEDDWESEYTDEWSEDSLVGDDQDIVNPSSRPYLTDSDDLDELRLEHEGGREEADLPSPRARKRAHEESDDEEDVDGHWAAQAEAEIASARSLALTEPRIQGTPPKRARRDAPAPRIVEEAYLASYLRAASVPPTPSRQRKRSSEELDGEETVDHGGLADGETKRPRITSPMTPPKQHPQTDFRRRSGSIPFTEEGQVAPTRHSRPGKHRQSVPRNPSPTPRVTDMGADGLYRFKDDEPV